MASRPLLVHAVLGLVALMAGWAWAFSSPPGSSPDDDYHLASIWCPPPAATSGCPWKAGPDGTAKLIAVPTRIAATACYAGRTTESGFCVDRLDLGVTWTDRFDKGGYPGPYYRIMHVFASAQVGRSVLAMRMVNVLIAVILLGGASLALTPKLRPMAGIGITGTMVPLGAFIFASVNPSSWAVTGVVAATLGLVACLAGDTRGRRIGGATIAVAGSVLAAVARSDSGLFLGMVLFSLSVLYLDRLRRLWVWPVLAAILAAAIWALTHGAQASTTFEPPPHASTWGLFLHNLPDLASIPAGVFGLTWGLGWLDTPMPSLVSIPALLSVAGIVTVGLASMSARKAIALAAPVAGAFALPLVRLQLGGQAVGEWVQPRYVLSAVMVLVVLLLLHRGRDRAVKFTRRQAWAVVVMLSLANAVALSTNIRRYVTGADVWNGNLDADIEWWWPTPPGPTLTLLLGSITFSALLVGVWWHALRSRPVTADTSGADRMAVGATAADTTSTKDAAITAHTAEHVPALRESDHT